LLIALIASRRRFTVRSERETVARGVAFALVLLLLALVYGVAGFYLLDQRDFGVVFGLGDSIRRAVREFVLLGNPDITAHTRHAHVFLDSLDAVGGLAAALALFSLAMPVRYRLRTQPHERLLVQHLLDEYGGASQDFFKLWPDKSYVFAPDRRAAVAYAVRSGVAVALGDPVGEPSAIPVALDAFLRLCRDNAWLPAFHQVSPLLLTLYRSRDMQVLKIGEEASVELTQLRERLETSKSLRQLRRRFEREQFRVERVEAPVGGVLFAELEAVSAEWLSIPGRRERRFTMGRFERDYLATTPVYVARDAAGSAAAFVNEIPSYRPSEATVDLMRHRLEVPNGTMDFLFTEVMLDAQRRGFAWFSLGLAPLAGVGDSPEATLEERAVGELFDRLNRFLSYKGLRAYKSKFFPEWQDRFLVYSGGPLGLMRTTLGLTRLTDG